MLLVLDDTDASFTLDLHFLLYDSDTDKVGIEIRTVDPEGGESSRSELLEVTSNNRQGREAIRLKILADGKTGVYAFEILTRQLAAPISARASTGKLVHCLPAGGLRHIASATWGGRFWMAPESASAQIVVHYPKQKHWTHQGDPKVGPGWARLVALDRRGRLIGESRLTGREKSGYPAGDPLRFTAGSGLYSVLIGNRSHRMLHRLDGNGPFVAPHADQWFDPTRHRPRPDLDRLGCSARSASSRRPSRDAPRLLASAQREGRHPEGEHGRVVESLLRAGHPWDVRIYPTGDARIDAVIEPRLRRRFDGLARLGERDEPSP